MNAVPLRSQHNAEFTAFLPFSQHSLIPSIVLCIDMRENKGYTFKKKETHRCELNRQIAALRPNAL